MPSYKTSFFIFQEDIGSTAENLKNLSRDYSSFIYPVLGPIDLELVAKPLGSARFNKVRHGCTMAAFSKALVNEAGLLQLVFCGSDICQPSVSAETKYFSLQPDRCQNGV